MQGLDSNLNPKIPPFEVLSSKMGSLLRGSYSENDVDNYLLRLSKEIGEDELNSSKFLEQILNFLDSRGQKFNRVLFNHIIEYGNYSKDNVINLKDFYKTYFIIYESMKSNLTSLGGNCTALSNELDQLAIKLMKAKNTEKVLDNVTGLTSTSRLIFELVELNKDKNIQPSPKLWKLEVTCNEEKSQIEINEIYIKKVKKMRITKPVSAASIQIVSAGESFSLKETINLGGIIDKPEKRVFEIPKFGNCVVSFFYMQSKLSFINKSIAEIENRVNDEKQNFSFLENSIRLMESPFEKMIQAMGKTAKVDKSMSNLKGFQFLSQKSNLEVSEKIEHLIGKITGNPIIIWENILFFMNRILLILMILMFYYRSDFPTLCLSLSIFGIQSGLISKVFYGKILTGSIISLLFDVIWICFYTYHWNSESEPDLTESRNMRKLATVVTYLIILVKGVMIFSLWRAWLVMKIRILNPRELKSSSSTGVIKQELYTSARDRLRYLEDTLVTYENN